MSVNAELNVEGMSCHHCKAAVEKRLTALEGVEKVSVDLDAKKVTVGFDESKTTLLTIKQAILEEGYTVMEL